MYTDILGQVDIAIMTIYWDSQQEVFDAAHLLRGAVAGNFPDVPLFHQHREDGNIYQYPLIQYRWHKRQGVIAGINEGAELLTNISLAGQEMRLGGQRLKVMEADIDFCCYDLLVASALQRYYFKSPWLPFNQENYRKYKKMDRKEQILERDRLLVANILTTLSSLGVHVPCQLYAAFILQKSVTCQYKSEDFLGFQGDILVNFDEFYIRIIE